MISYLFI